MSNMQEEIVDLLVIGSGAGGMITAIRAHDLGLKTLIVEKAALFGGSSAYSGGVVWVPNNKQMKAQGIADSEDEGFRYLEQITQGSSSSVKLRTYVDNAARMLEYLAQNSDVKFTSISKYPDYFPEIEGGKQGGRSCEPDVFNGHLLGDEYERLRMCPKDVHILARLTVRASEGSMFMEGTLYSKWLIVKRLIAYYLDFRARSKGWFNTSLTLGYALVARARYSLMKRDVPLWLNTKLEDLIVENGRVVGAILLQSNVGFKSDSKGEIKPIRVMARKGVVLATGGFDHNAELRKKYQQAPTGSDWAAGAESNTGDAIAIAEKLNADFALMDDAWWCPIFKVPYEQGFIRLVIYEKNMPGAIIVNAKGQRFMNEAAPYNEVVKNIYKANKEDAATIPCYLIFDARYRYNYAVGRYLPGYVAPDKKLHKEAWEFMIKADSLTELAAKLNIDAQGLEQTVKHFNIDADAGKDSLFQRGESAQDRYYTARAKEFKNPCLGPLKQAPFYAVSIWPGDIGTKGGMVTDSSARVLTKEGEPIVGLYATGNCSAAVMGNTYPGAGGTLGPAMTFGFLAAEHAAGYK